jgi:hypothetical protein
MSFALSLGSLLGRFLMISVRPRFFDLFWERFKAFSVVADGMQRSRYQSLPLRMQICFLFFALSSVAGSARLAIVGLVAGGGLLIEKQKFWASQKDM